MKEVKKYYECKMCENFLNCLGDLQRHMLLDHLLKIDCQKTYLINFLKIKLFAIINLYFNIHI